MKPFLCILILTCVPVYSQKYGQKMDDKQPFRMGKLNTIWRKAQKVLSGATLSSLFTDLIMQDRKEKELKVAKLESLDNDGLIEAAVRQSLVDLLHKYHLVQHFPNYKDSERKSGQSDIKDARLKKIWKEAAQSGFTAEEMDTLREEMDHHQQKVDVYNSLKDSLDELEGKVDNSLENLDEKESVWKNLSETNKQMKDTHRDMNSNFEQMKERLEKLRAQRPFEDPRVQQLWALAQGTTMTEDEMQSFRKELDHFKHRIKKSKFLSEQVKKPNINGNGIHPQKKISEDIQKQALQYEAKVNKYHEDLKYRVQKRLDEL